MTRTANVTVHLRLTLPESYTGEIGDDVEADVRYALTLDVDSTLGGAELEVIDVSCPVIDDDEPLPDEEDA